MESLSDEVWDVVIAGTSIPQSLLALSLSRSGKKILHVDHHDYYGGEDAGLSLQDVENWILEVNGGHSNTFKDATLTKPPADAGKLAPSRSYTLSLNPQIIYAQSAILPTLVASRVHTQLEFLAVGSLWIHRAGILQKVPSTREDVFNDDTLSMKDKRGLMKFLRYVLQEEDDQGPNDPEDSQISFQEALTSKFKISESLQAPLQALALSPLPPSLTRFDTALARIRRHMRSLGYFGPGFGAVVAKYGGNSELAQVACRSGAVGGFTYLLGNRLEDLKIIKNTTAANITPDVNDEQQNMIEGILPDGTRIISRLVVGGRDDLPNSEGGPSSANSTSAWRSISIVTDPLRNLFPQTADNGPVPAVAIVFADAGATGAETAPIYLQVHSEDTGECPSGQCIIYASIADHSPSAKLRLEKSVTDFLATCGVGTSNVWSLSYAYSGADLSSQAGYTPSEMSAQVTSLAPRPLDIAFSDDVLTSVKDVWKLILGDDAHDDTFLRFEERENESEND
ncbi:hypothetical protein LTR84_000940 [Exophiala bonariae]|uniref:Rab proteins geranylgeranyltransferase n=1 Tax=Exophiala bonariae TaxID=1690606 RepID=A0AAV9NTQ2_9EURO|nr:hypothetical protein LTR84_000940 [Exophiala bonariae]